MSCAGPFYVCDLIHFYVELWYRDLTLEAHRTERRRRAECQSKQTPIQDDFVTIPQPV